MAKLGFDGKKVLLLCESEREKDREKTFVLSSASSRLVQDRVLRLRS